MSYEDDEPVHRPLPREWKPFWPDAIERSSIITVAVFGVIAVGLSIPPVIYFWIDETGRRLAPTSAAPTGFELLGFASLVLGMLALVAALAEFRRRRKVLREASAILTRLLDPWDRGDRDQDPAEVRAVAAAMVGTLTNMGDLRRAEQLTEQLRAGRVAT
jgi:hypothetical protein